MFHLGKSKNWVNFCIFFPRFFVLDLLLRDRGGPSGMPGEKELEKEEYLFLRFSGNFNYNGLLNPR